jgi:hypothetical protein
VQPPPAALAPAAAANTAVPTATAAASILSVPALEVRLTDLLSRLWHVPSRPAAAGAHCGACGAPGSGTLARELRGMLHDVAAAHAAEMAAAKSRHEEEVAEIKAAAVRRFKELMGQQQDQRPQ